MGGVCPGGDVVVAQPGYWQSDVDVLALHSCPVGACCVDPDTVGSFQGCALNSTTRCASDRDPESVICARCRSGLRSLGGRCYDDCSSDQLIRR